MNQVIMITNSPEESEKTAESWAKQFQWGDRIALVGELGAGKTTFVRGLYRGLGGTAEELVSSPTFTLMQSYEVKDGKLHHWDWYRLNKAGDLNLLDWEEYWEDPQSLHLVEWGNKFDGNYRDFTYVITLDEIGEDKRRIEMRKVRSQN